MGRRLLKDIFAYDFFNLGLTTACFKISGERPACEGVYYPSKYK